MLLTASAPCEISVDERRREVVGIESAIRWDVVRRAGVRRTNKAIEPALNHHRNSFSLSVLTGSHPPDHIHTLHDVTHQCEQRIHTSEAVILNKPGPVIISSNCTTVFVVVCRPRLSD